MKWYEKMFVKGYNYLQFLQVKANREQHEQYVEENYVRSTAPQATTQPQTGTDKDGEKLPIGGTRSSEPSGNLLNFNASGQLEVLEPEFAIEWLPTIEHLMAWHQDVSQAGDNIKQLGNTPHTYKFIADLPDKVEKEAAAYLRKRERTWYDFSAGANSLKNDLFSQVMITGAVSIEAIPESDLSRVRQVVRVNAKNIRFVYDHKADKYYPYQKTTRLYNSGALAGLKELNTFSYKYISNQRHGESPYATPPFLSALESIMTQRWMMDNFKRLMKMLGMLGFVSMNVAKPRDKNENETYEQYWDYCERYLDRLAPMLEKTISKGYAIGFTKTHEFAIEGNKMNVEGAKGLYEMIIHMVAAGLKQDPNMLGWNFSTTETFGTVIMNKMASQVENFQQTVASAWEAIARNELLLGGFDPDILDEVRFRAPMIGDESKAQETRGKLIKNVITLRNENIIDQLQAAIELGYDKPAGDAPELPPPGTPPGQPPSKGKENGDKGKDKPKKGKESNVAQTIDFLDIPLVIEPGMIAREEFALKAHVTPFAYDLPEGCNCGTASLGVGDFHDTTIEKYIQGYMSAVTKRFNTATGNIANDIADILFTLPKTATKREVVDRVLFTMYRRWQDEFMGPQRAITKKHVDRVYNFYRHDRSVFGPENQFAEQSFAFTIPDAAFDLFDFRAIDYLNGLDNLFLGKFITDTDVRKKVVAFIEEAYLNGDTPIGKNSIGLDKFKNEFKKTVRLAQWKIRRILETTVNKIRNYAGINYMSQANVEKFEIVEVMDLITCPWCRHMNGKSFVVQTAKDRVNRVINGGPEEVANLSPFATTIKIDEFTKMDAVNLQTNGFDSPSYHPHCRGRSIAVI